MSSLVKKGGTLFAPKIKKIVRKKQTPTPGPSQRQSQTPKPNQPATPPATQITNKEQDDEKNTSKSQEKDIDNSIKESNMQLASPASTQVQEQPSFRMTLSTASPQKPIKNETDIDPKDKSAPNENAIASSSEDEDDNEDDDNNFKPPVDSNTARRQSVTQRRRLSSINPPGGRSRSASISLNADPNHIPAKIGIPIGKPTKRRRSLAQNRATKKIALTATPKVAKPINISISDAPKVVDKGAESKEEKQRPVKKSDKKGVSDEFIVGIDPVTQKLTKFRRKGNSAVRLKKEEGDTIIKTEDGAIKKEEGAEKTTPEVPEEPEGLITTITNIHQIPSKIKDEDIELFGEVDIDLEEMTMAELCKPTIQIGKVSSNFMLAKEATYELRQKRNQRKRDRQLARAERISLEEAVKKNEEARRQNGEVFVSSSESQRKPDALFDEDPPEASSSLKLVFNADGKLGVSEESAIVAKPRADVNTRSVENSNPFANPITSTTYSKRVHTDKWTPDELNQFYQALSMFGTDFSLISQLFPYRSRKQIKLKFNLEERKFPEIVELALKRKLPVDFQEYCKNIKNDIKSLEYYNEELRKVRIEHEESMNAIVLEREKALKEDAEANRRREIEIRTGAKPMTRAEKVKELRKNEMVVGSIDDMKRQREVAE